MKKLIGCLLLMFLLVGCNSQLEESNRLRKKFEQDCLEHNNTLSVTITVGAWNTSVSSTCTMNGGK
ncbi:MAG: hypothetical protein RBS24_06525 [Bacilli bacterium]|nr:hypothetical protein [Bacilli bacterium]